MGTAGQNQEKQPNSRPESGKAFGQQADDPGVLIANQHQSGSQDLLRKADNSCGPSEPAS
jgi:hypothetical protein